MLMLRPNRCWIALGLALATVGVGRAADPPTVVRLEPAPGPLANPYKGWCPYTDANPIRQPYSMVYHYASWRELEPEAGRFAFDAWERRAWDVPAGRGKHVVFRVYVDYPGRPSGLPDWLKDKVKLTPYTDHGGGLSPDYEDADLVEGLERLIAALGRRYDADPRVAFVELGLLGHWGEWHTYPAVKLMASAAVERRVIDAYHRAFPTVGLLARTARDDAGRRDWLGYHDDMFPEDTDNGQDWSFLAVIRQAGRLDNWKRASVGGEMVPNAARKWLGPDFARTMAMAEAAHFSWVGPYCPALEQDRSPEFRARSEALVRKLGYQFRWDRATVPAAITAGEPFAIALQGVNEGVAPFPRPWPVEVALLKDDKPVARARLSVDVRTWLPGAIQLDGRATLTAPPGRYRLALGIIDPRTDRPGVEFANRAESRGGWLIFSSSAAVSGPR